MIHNPITGGSGVYEIISRYPPHVLVALPLRQNPALYNRALVEMCLTQLRMTYPRINEIVASYEQTAENGIVLQLIVR